MTHVPLEEPFPQALARLIRGRRSIRRFLPAAVPDSDIEFVLEAGRWAPSAGNAQPWIFFVIRSLQTRKALAKAASQKFLSQAPVVLAVCADISRAQNAYGSRGAQLYCIQDTAAAVQNMLLAATALGLGSCWVGAFDENAVSSLLDLPESIRPVALVPLGTAAEEPLARQRRPLEEVIREID